MSNCAYFASRTPSATFSKSQKTAMLFVSVVGVMERDDRSFFPALHRQSARSPSNQAAGEVGDVREAEPLQDHHGLGGARAGTACGDDRARLVELGGALRELAERNQARLRDVAERPAPFLGLAHVHDLRLGDV